jgi:hypothetical protein
LSHPDILIKSVISAGSGFGILLKKLKGIDIMGRIKG